MCPSGKVNFCARPGVSRLEAGEDAVLAGAGSAGDVGAVWLVTDRSGLLCWTVQAVLESTMPASMAAASDWCMLQVFNSSPRKLRGQGAPGQRIPLPPASEHALKHRGVPPKVIGGFGPYQGSPQSWVTRTRTGTSVDISTGACSAPSPATCMGRRPLSPSPAGRLQADKHEFRDSSRTSCPCVGHPSGNPTRTLDFCHCRQRQVSAR
jgi:hypothetical protein